MGWTGIGSVFRYDIDSVYITNLKFPLGLTLRLSLWQAFITVGGSDAKKWHACRVMLAGWQWYYMNSHGTGYYTVTFQDK